MLAEIVDGFLAQHPPAVRLQLRRPLGYYAPVAYRDLVRAGVLRIIDGKPGREPGPRYDLTAKGRKLLLKGARLRPGTNTIDIRVGQFRYVPGSAVLDHDDWDGPAVTFRYYFNGNANTDMLLRAGLAMDWVVDNYWRPHVNLDKVGRLGEETLPLQVCHGKWMVRKSPPYLCSHP
jgi:hypothetical protein